MLKTTLLLLDVTLIIRVIVYILSISLTPLEESATKLQPSFKPARVIFTYNVYKLLRFATIVSLVITIIKW